MSYAPKAHQQNVSFPIPQTCFQTTHFVIEQ